MYYLAVMIVCTFALDFTTKRAMPRFARFSSGVVVLTEISSVRLGVFDPSSGSFFRWTPHAAK